VGVSGMLPGLSSVRLRETTEELVVEIDIPDEIDLARVSVERSDGTLEIRLPRIARLVGFHPEASGV